ncbi:ribonuclease P [Thelephora terrestris]|uniref:Ribonuclease P n=1 Tax=Thelephora terrestris TaxID=56493 RepID=A0A9P6H3D1_9AGAM|nr:ribonuclease P [Thelephora terrestris]
MSRSSDVIAFGSNQRGTDETWCIDTRGVLTISIDPGTYQRLGLLGTPLPWKPHKDRYTVVLSQKVPKGEKHWNPLGPKQRSALELYDELREKAGFDAWDVVYHLKGNGSLAGTTVQSRSFQVQSRKATHTDFRIPHISLSPPTDADNEEMEDWKTSLAEFQEWLGLACMGSQRLHASDNVDPYIASYYPPEPNTVGTITHLRWSGLLHPDLTSALLQTCLDVLSADTPPPFIGILAHSNTNTPVGFLNAQKPERAAPVRLTRADGEDTRCIILTSDGRWTLTEIIGQWDARWG